MTIDTKRPSKAEHVLREYRLQIDADGTMIGVSRQAVDEVLDEIERLQGIANAFEIVKEQRDSAEAKLAMVRRITDGDWSMVVNGEPSHYDKLGKCDHDRYGYENCGTCIDELLTLALDGKRVPELESET